MMSASNFSIEIFTTVINNSLRTPYSTLLNGIVFGRSISEIPYLYDNFKKAGLLHIMVLSGTNISLLGAMLEAFFGFLPKRFAVSLTICLIILFSISTGLEPPTLRAMIMGTISLLAILFHRQTAALYSLLLSGIVMLFLQPELITSVSFLLSFGATLGIVLFGKPLARRPWWFPQELQITLAAQVFTTPIILIYFRQLSILSPVANLLVTFCVAPLMLIGFSISLIGSIAPMFTTPLSWLATGIIKYLITITNVINSVPYSFIQL